jgi:hypothetical protein
MVQVGLRGPNAASSQFWSLVGILVSLATEFLLYSFLADFDLNV